MSLLKTHPCIDGNYIFKNVIEKSADIYHPFNHYALVESLNYYIGMHEMLILASLSKKFRTCIELLWNKNVNMEPENRAIDAINHQCMSCFEMNKHYQNNSEILIAIYKYGAKKILKKYKKGSYKIKNLTSDVINQCVLYGVSQDYYFLEKLLKYNSIINADLELICTHINEKILTYILNHYSYNMPTLQQFKILLPHLCLYNKKYSILKWQELLTVDECDLLYTLFKNSIDNDIQNVLLEQYLKLLNYDGKTEIKNLNECIEWIAIHGDSNIVKYLKSKNLSTEHNLLLTEKYYEFYYHSNLTYLNESIENNILSVKLALKYGRTSYYIDKLDNNAIINLLPPITSYYLLNKLIQKLEDVPFTATQIDILYNKVDEKKSLTAPELLIKFIKLNHIPIDLKIKMLPYLYEQQLGEHADFLGTTREYNLLSLQMAEPYKNAYVYVSHLTFRDKISMIEKYKHNYNIVRVLVHHMKFYDINSYYPSNNLRIYTELKYDNDIECKRQYQVSKNITKTYLQERSLEHFNWLLKCDIVNYKELVCLIFEDVKFKYEFASKNFNYMIALMNFIVTHEEFKMIDVHKVLMFLKYYVNNESICLEIIKHPFLKKLIIN